MRKVRGLSNRGERETVQSAAGVRPIVIDIEDPALLEEARLVASVTRRQIITLSTGEGSGSGGDGGGGSREMLEGLKEKLKEKLESGQPGRGGLILLTDRATDLCCLPGVRVHRVDLMEPSLLNGGSVDLAEQIGVEDPLRIAVIGGHGGAGTSIFAAGLAAALGDLTCRDALLVDRDPLSQGLATVLGIENQPGWYADDVPPDAREKEILQNCPELDGVHVLGRFSAGFMAQRVQESERSVAELAAVILRAVMVVDCGRCLPGTQEWETQWASLKPDAVVIVSALTVAGLAGAKDARYAVEDAGLGEVSHVIRRIPHSATTAAMAMVLLGQRPACEWDVDVDLACDLDRGALNLHRGSLSKAARTVAGSILASGVTDALDLSGVKSERDVA